MTASVNKVVLLGNLCADPEVRRLNNGDPVANMRVATSERWKSKDGERREKTEFHNVTAFGGMAETVERFLRKGSKVYIEGQLQTRKWQDRDGNDRYTTEVVMQGFRGQLVMLDGKGESGPQQASQPQDTGSDPLEDDIPF